MGKVKKIKVSWAESTEPKVSLMQQIADDNTAKMKNRQKLRLRNDEEEEFVDAKTTQKILIAARQQQQEMEEESGLGSLKVVNKPTVKLGNNLSDEEEDSDAEGVTGTEYYEDIKINEEDERALEMFIDMNRQPAKTLADIIMEKLTEKKTELQTQFSDVGSVQIQEILPRVKAMYKGIMYYQNTEVGKYPKLSKWYQV